ncbi:LLM class flavin-dependent oxidoreductase [Solirubrobacter soli]|uniref:LLM class flavin-dependent oxidoreductase n=1 Tax=Solirubrobacter soli TaxID=363832 RepID=UPI00069DD225|nr:LLM class flavin-dependent oxidoreductase [Solirubrobacter soli]
MSARLSVSLQNDWPIAASVADARLAEELGFAEVWINENGHHRGAFTQAAAIAAATSEIGIGIGVVNPFHRHPSVIAMEAASLDELSGGRLKLGLGASLWNLRNLGEDDPRTAKPLTATVEAIRIIRALLRGEPGIESEIYTVSPRARLDFEPLRRDLPLYIGAVNRRMMRAAGQWADAVELGAIMSIGYVKWALALVDEGARLSGRTLADLDIAAPLMTAVATDHDAAREAVKEPLAYYLYRVEPVVTDESGADPEAIAAVAAAVRDDGPAAGARYVTDELIDTFTAAGEPGHVARRLSEYAAAGIHGLIAQIQGTPRDESFRLLATEVLPAIQPPVGAA